MHKDLLKIHSFCLYAFIFLLPWQTIWIMREVFYGNEKWQYGTIGIYASDIFLIAWIFLSIYLYFDHISKWLVQNKKIIFVLLCFELWLFMSILWANDTMLAFYRTLTLSCAIDLLILLWIIPIPRNTSLVFIISACIHAIIGIIQFFAQKTVALSYLGMQLHDISWGGTATITSHGEQWLRAYGGLPHPNVLGGLLLVSILLVTTHYINTTKRSYLYTIPFLLVYIVLIIGIIVTFSRTIWLIGCINLCGLFIYFFIYTKKISRTIILLMTICTTITIFGIFFGHLFFTRITHDTQLSHNSFSDRKIYLTHAYTLIKDHPFIGTGIGNYTNTIYHAHKASYPIWFFQPVHNAYVLLCTEIGIIGFFLLFSFVVFFLRTFQKTFSFKKPDHVTYTLIIFSFCVISLFDHWIWSSHFGVLLCAFFIGIIFNQQTKDTP